nr:uncharacterized protein LOC112211857 [Halyomorpha halys]
MLTEEYRAAAEPTSKLRLKCILQLFIDPHGVLHVGGRLNLAPQPFAVKHPALIPKDQSITRLIITHAHVTNLHASPFATHSFIRQWFWIIDGRNVVRHLLAKCNRCFQIRSQ